MHSNYELRNVKRTPSLSIGESPYSAKDFIGETRALKDAPRSHAGQQAIFCARLLEES